MQFVIYFEKRMQCGLFDWMRAFCSLYFSTLLIVARQLLKRRRHSSKILCFAADIVFVLLKTIVCAAADLMLVRLRKFVCAAADLEMLPLKTFVGDRVGAAQDIYLCSG